MQGGVGGAQPLLDLGQVLEDLPGRRRRADEPRITVLPMQPRPEELADHAEGKVALQLPAASAQHGNPGALRQPPRLGQQPRLPDPGPALDQRHPPLARDRPLGEAGELSELTLALNQVSGRGYGPVASFIECLLPS